MAGPARPRGGRGAPARGSPAARTPPGPPRGPPPRGGRPPPARLPPEGRVRRDGPAVDRLDRLHLAVDLPQRDRAELGADAAHREGVVDEGDDDGDPQEDQVVAVDVVAHLRDREDLHRRPEQQPDAQELREREEGRPERPVGLGLAQAQDDERDVDEDVRGRPSEHAREHELDERLARRGVEDVHEDRDERHHRDPDHGRAGRRQEVAERARGLLGVRHAVEQARDAGQQRVQRGDGGGDGDDPHPPLARVPEDRDRHGHVRERRRVPELLGGHVARGGHAEQDERHGDEPEPEEHAQRQLPLRVVELLGQRARVLQADEREDRQPEEPAQDAPVEVRGRQRRPDDLARAKAEDADEAEGEDGEGHHPGEHDLHDRERPDPEDVERRDGQDDDDDPDLRVAADAEELREDDRGEQRLGRGREDHDRHVAQERRERAGERPEPRADVLVHRAGLGDHRRELGEAQRLHVHRDEADGQRHDEDPARREPLADADEHRRGDDEPEHGADRRRQPDGAPLELRRLRMTLHCPSFASSAAERRPCGYITQGAGGASTADRSVEHRPRRRGDRRPTGARRAP
ncbi:MAG: hypothetical protein AVDCRST_MAG13-2904 [uncultured Solirubrobacteraceae bacterium]|uniref:Uncharacterized protein n=1 Tax=uncultured Solirubrobacteraceae bacterium TaxID=1162706 RepID=A0A6J4T4F5_9ACTN|nr:MAG: hypothetical protein AVDCRST_MAG13-2904 [uncultured Solirubrobacteraceae bacterium]